MVLLQGQAKHPHAPAGVLHRFVFPGDPVPYLVIPEVAKYLGVSLKVSSFFFLTSRISARLRQTCCALFRHGGLCPSLVSWLKN